MVDFVALLEAAQNGDGILHAWFVNLHRLETTLQGRVLLDVFAIFVERGGSDAAQFPAGQLWLEQIGGIHRTFAGTGSDNGVQFVDKQNDLAFAGSDFLQKGLEPFFKFPAIFRSGEHAAEVHGNESFAHERFRDIARDDPPRQAFSDGGLAHAGFADEDRVVFAATTQDLHDTADFVIAADHRVDFSGLGAGRQVGAVFFQRLVFPFRVGIGDFLGAADFLQRGEQGGVGDMEGF